MSSNARAQIDMTAWAEVGAVANADARATYGALGHRVVPAVLIEDCTLLGAQIKGALAVDVAYHAIAKLNSIFDGDYLHASRALRFRHV